jgi:phosphoesterase RecJ-like protein
MSGIDKICAGIKKYGNFLITAHMNLEGDALGSELAFYALIRKLGKKGVILNADAVPPAYAFLPGTDKIRRLGPGSGRIAFDCMAVLDCAGTERTGGVWELNAAGKPVLNIDHHVSNRGFGDACWIDPRASSCSEMIYRLYKHMHVPISGPEAVCMYTGMMTDTGSFRYSNTGSLTHWASAELLRHVNVPLVYRNVYENIPPQEAKILINSLSGMNSSARGRIVYFRMKNSLPGGKPMFADLGDHLLSFGRSIEGAEVVLLFKESGNKVRVNLRSQGRVDVNKIAALFGGGGHKTAAGCTLSGDPALIAKKVLAAVRRNLG